MERKTKENGEDEKRQLKSWMRRNIIQHLDTKYHYKGN